MGSKSSRTTYKRQREPFGHESSRQESKNFAAFSGLAAARGSSYRNSTPSKLRTRSATSYLDKTSPPSSVIARMADENRSSLSCSTKCTYIREDSSRIFLRIDNPSSEDIMFVLAAEDFGLKEAIRLQCLFDS